MIALAEELAVCMGYMGLALSSLHMKWDTYFLFCWPHRMGRVLVSAEWEVKNIAELTVERDTLTTLKATRWAPASLKLPLRDSPVELQPPRSALPVWRRWLGPPVDIRTLVTQRSNVQAQNIVLEERLRRATPSFAAACKCGSL